MYTNFRFEDDRWFADMVDEDNVTVVRVGLEEVRKYSPASLQSQNTKTNELETKVETLTTKVLTDLEKKGDCGC